MYLSMFYLTPQERKFIAIIMIVFIMGAGVQLLLRRDIAPVRWAKSVRQFKININTARAEQFQMLPGIGATLTSRIIDYRKQKGPFRALEDLENVDGLTAKRFGRIKELIEL
jgi:competence ComEA-like helix-hairpin-helix protein